MDNVNVIRTGFMAPDFSLPDTQGNILSLKEFIRDSFAAVCFFSDEQADRVQSYLKDLNSALPETASGLPVSVIAVSPEKISKLSQMKEELELSYPVLSDNGMVVSRKFYVVNSSDPKPGVHFTVFVVDDEGIVRHRVSEVDEVSKFDFNLLKSKISALI